MPEAPREEIPQAPAGVIRDPHETSQWKPANHEPSIISWIKYILYIYYIIDSNCIPILSENFGDKSPVWMVHHGQPPSNYRWRILPIHGVLRSSHIRLKPGNVRHVLRQAWDVWCSRAMKRPVNGLSLITLW